MNSTQRVIVIVGVAVVAALGFVVLKAAQTTGGDHPGAEAGTTVPAASATAPGEARAPARPTPARAAVPAVPRIVVRGLEPVDGVKQFVFRKGDTIQFTVDSDEPEEIHLHGYDVAAEVAPGRPATFVVPASIEGIFEAELEDAGVQIASITVEP